MIIISHYLYLIQGASFLNKSPYQLTTTKNEELNLQEREFLEKGLIKESSSPCDVPIILATKKNAEL